MDRAAALNVPFATLEASSSGWDATEVWRERIHAPRQPLRSSAPVIASFLDASSGWDPLETWRLRVQRSRATPR